MEERTTEKRTSRAKNSQRRSALKTVGKVLLTLLLIFACTSAMLAGIFLTYVKTTLTPVLSVRAEDYNMKLSSVVYYQDKESGEWLELQKVHGTENRIWADIEQMPPALWQATVSIEDERFFQHKGVDWKRTLGATLTMFLGGNDSYGGSTITQQLLKNITHDNGNTVNRKVREIFRALEFEKNYTKTQILELYLNTIYLGKGCYGVQTAAEFYFGKDVSELTTAECASLIAITNNPSLYGPMYDVTYTRSDGTTITPRQLNKQRQENILKKMSEVVNPDTGKPYLTQEEKAAAQAEQLVFLDGTTSAEDILAQANSGVQINNWFVEQLIKDVASDLAKVKGVDESAAVTLLNNGGYQIYSTLDPEIQRIAERAYENTENLNVHSPKGEQLQSGITIMDPYNGKIVAMVGAIGPKMGNLVDNFATQRHQVGSSIKPLTVYSAAIDAGAVTPATVFDDYPVRLYRGSPWPKNSPSNYRGRTTVATGVQHSINTIAVQTLETLGCPESFVYATEKLGLRLAAEDMAVSPLGMGGLTYGLSTVEMAAAYSCFANGGVYNSPKMYVEVRDSNGQVVLSNEGDTHVAMKESTAHLMNQMLQSVVTGGTGTSANFGGMTIAGKTGTTSDNRDRYFVGYTPYYCAAVWTGYRTNERIRYSGNPSITMWRLVMKEVHQNLPNKGFFRPSGGLESVTICADSGKLCTDACLHDLRGSRAVTMTVPAGKAPKESCTMHKLVYYCPEGQCIATSQCPHDAVIQIAALDCPREDYGASIRAGDDGYTIQGMYRALGVSVKDLPEDPTELLAGAVCPVHGEGGAFDPDATIEPDFPPLDPTPTEPDAPSEQTPEEPKAAEPTPPAEPDGSANADDWASDLWNNG